MKGISALALVVAAIGTGSIPAAASAQTGYAESAGDTLARNVRILASDPRNFEALVAAGRAALETGDPEAAASFFGRAQEINPNSYLPPAGMGAALAATGEASESLTYFARAQQLGATVASIGADRGLAYDLLGQQAAAQSDYTAALSGAAADDARRRLALSLAISGDQANALSTLQPLLMRSDPGAKRARAFILALAGNIGEAETALNYMMPGASARMDPFFRRLSALAPAQKAAAVDLGIFPDSGAATYASATLSTPAPAPVQANARSGDRLASIDQLLQRDSESSAAVSSPPQRPYQPAIVPTPPQVEYSAPVQLASISRPAIEQARDTDSQVQIARVASDPGARKIWLQLASGANPAAFPDQFQRIRARDPSLFAGISGYVADDGPKARLVIGPFHSSDDARMFAEALSSDNIDSFNWTSNPDQPVTRLSGQ